MTVEENILAILETRHLGRDERQRRLERMLDELSIKHLRKSKAYSLSGGERRRLEITRALVTEPKFMLLDEPFAGVDPIAVHDIQTIVAGLRHRGIGVLITDHNVEQTLDIVDRAYIMFEGKVQAAGTVRELVYDDRVAAAVPRTHPDGAAPGPPGGGGMRDRSLPAYQPAAGAAGQSAALPGHGHAVHAHDGPAAAPEAGAAGQSVPRAARAGGGGRRSRDGQPEEEKEQKEKEDEIDWEEILLNGFEVGGTREQYEQQEYTEPVTVETRDLIDHLREQLQMLDADAPPAAAGRGVPGQHQRRGLPRRLAGGDPRLGEPADRRARRRRGRRRRRRTTTEHEAAGAEDRSRRRPAAPGRLRAASTPWPKSEEMLGVHPAARPAGHRRPRPAGVPAASSSAKPKDTDSLTYRLVAEAFPDLIAHRWNDLAKRFGVEPGGGAGAPPTSWPGSTPSPASSTPTRATATSSPT